MNSDRPHHFFMLPSTFFLCPCLWKTLKDFFKYDTINCPIRTHLIHHHLFLFLCSFFFFFFFIVTCLNLCMYEIIYFTRCKKFFSSLFWRRVGTWAMEKVALETMKRQSYHIYRISHANHEAPFEYILA